MEEKIANMPGKSLGEMKAALGNDFSYGEIKMVLAHLKHSQEA